MSLGPLIYSTCHIIGHSFWGATIGRCRVKRKKKEIVFENIYVHWCFACVYVCVRVSDTLGLELLTVGAAMWVL